MSSHILDNFQRGLQITTIVAPLLFYTTAAIVQSFLSTAETKHERLNLWRFQICISSLIVVITTVEAFVVALKSDPYSTADPQLVYQLFLNLIWTILFLGVIGCWGATGYPHYGSWSILFVLSNGVMVIRKIENEANLFPLLFIFQLCRLVLNFSLIGVGSICLFVRKPQDDGMADEAQPLLSSEEPSKTKKGKEKDQEELDRENIRRRPFWEYLASFKVFIPFMYPSSREQQIYVTGMSICTLLGRLIAFSLPLCLGRVIDCLNSSEMPWRAIILYGSLKLASSAAGIPMLNDWLHIKVSTDMTTNLNRYSYNYIMSLSAEFHDSQKTSIMWSSMQNGQQVISLFHDTIFGVLPTLVDLVAAASILTFLFGPYMLYTIGITVVMFYWLMFQTLKQKTTLRRLWIDAFHDEYYQMTESSTNWTTVSQFGQIPHEIGKYRDKSSITQAALMTYWFCDLMARAARQLVPTISFVAACGIAAIQIIHQQHKIGDFVVLVTYWGQLTGPLGSLAHEFTTMGQKLVQAEKLLVLLEKKPATCDKEDASTFDFTQGAVEFRDVTFSYDGKRKVCNGISFQASPGKTIALVGPSGGGKSTILKLLYRFYDLEEGRILIDGQDIQKVKMETFRKHIATVPQNPALFNMTVMENVKYPDLECSDEEAIEACKAAALHDKIMTFTNGYDEKVGERGTKLSGGELQRLAIARAILKKSNILLLDEATSNVDSITESQIQGALAKLCAGKTAFVIAHRLSTILQADQILVIEDGRITESGAHSKLIINKGPYHNLWCSQLKLQERTKSSMPLSAVIDNDVSDLILDDTNLSTDSTPIMTQTTVSPDSNSTHEDKEEDTGSEISGNQS
ncbi:uncharacterized protein A1O9_11522 [Exophiala aquamarina CBS 119918]|uniref:ATPase n=1 Tax=Exophiala aquamarina CBS 119918 TaxID=1182545 RepID=A0A072NY15_9EURO|nr:uncharacterized protein A1O9_11522 [Exophiala aquamarina CBS 119918]KEF52282.1 hypothetical protein A1O9_11522 [Exophiala aquamarina CBS 119918]